MSMLETGVYSISESARLTGLPTSRVREWFRSRPATATSRGKKAAFVSDYHSIAEQKLISFHDLIEVFIAGQLRAANVTMQTVRKVHSALALEFKVKHPFCHRELCLSGKQILTRGLDEHGQEEIRDALTRQKIFPDIIRPFLKRLDYDEASRLASRWRIANAVVLNPKICFGQPIAEHAGIPTRILAQSFAANGQDAGFVAHWFNITKEDVNAAVAFESSLAA